MTEAYTDDTGEAAVGVNVASRVGHVYLYTLTGGDAAAINKRRADARQHMAEHQANSTGVVVHVGNEVKAGDVYPLMVSRDWATTDTSPHGATVNGQILLDGADTYWATSVLVDERLRIS